MRSCGSEGTAADPAIGTATDTATSPVAGLRVALVLAASTGGVGRHVHALATGLLARGARVAVVGPAETDARFGFRASGARFHPVEIPTAPRPVADARAVRALRPSLRGADVVHAHGLRAGLMTGLSLGPRRPIRSAFFVTWHNALPSGVSWRDRTKRRVGGTVQRVTARHADLTLGASPDLVERARAVGARGARYLPIGAPALPPPCRDTAALRAELGAEDRPVVLATGRLGPQKDYPTLLRAAAGLARRDIAPVVVIAGDGPLRGELAECVQREGLPVRLLGHREDVADLLRAADIVALPSVWEARPFAAQQALRAGRPLVATAVGGIPDLVGDAALLVPPGEPSALESVLARLLDEPGLGARLAEAGSARSADFPTEDDTTEQLAALYRGAVSARE